MKEILSLHGPLTIVFPGLGHVYEARFSDKMIFDLDFQSEREMNFTSRSGPTKGASRILHYTAEEIRRDVFMIYWQEHDMSTVVHIHDYEKGIVYASITLPDHTFLNLKGTLKKVK